MANCVRCGTLSMSPTLTHTECSLPWTSMLLLLLMPAHGEPGMAFPCPFLSTSQPLTFSAGLWNLFFKSSLHMTSSKFLSSVTLRLYRHSKSNVSPMSTGLRIQLSITEPIHFQVMLFSPLPFSQINKHLLRS